MMFLDNIATRLQHNISKQANGQRTPSHTNINKLWWSIYLPRITQYATSHDLLNEKLKTYFDEIYRK